MGFGVETDIRDYNGELVISHDIANKDAISLKYFFQQTEKYRNDSPLALNIKADGLQIKLKELIKEYNVSNYFVFDMSIPDGLIYINHGFNVFTRQSELEKEPSFYDMAAGVWIDQFNSCWIDKTIIKKHLKMNKKICIVSPELHGRDYILQWNKYKQFEYSFGIDQLMICTDYPFEAKEYFNG